MFDIWYKIKFKNKQAKNNFNLENKFNQLSVLACLIDNYYAENAILHPTIYWYLENYSIFIDLKQKILIALFLLASLLNN